jgi:hypothetical protein
MKIINLLLTTTTLGGLFTAGPAFAQVWMQTSAPTNHWAAVSSSADGSKLVAVAKGGPIYTSRDSGATWMATSAPNTNWTSVASSADGTKLVAAAAVFEGTQFERGGPIYVSADSGATWTASDAPNTNWSSVACSTDGSRLVAVAGGSLGAIRSAPSGPILTSSNSGITWTPASVADANCTSVASSADGTKLLAVGSGCPNYISWDSGVSWIPVSGSPFCQAASAASSLDGSRLIAGTYGIPKPGGDVFLVFTSINGGANWAMANLFPSYGRGLVASSAEGTTLVAAAGANAQGNGGSIVLSVDSGATWTFHGAPSTDWASVACSADGTKLVAAVNGGGIWTWQSTPAPALNLLPVGSNLVFSWLVPSMDFLLQENPDLNTPNWTDVTNTPALNLTNVLNQVIVPSPIGNRFYRLKH